MALLLVVGCGIRLPDPAPTSVTPNKGYNGEDTLIRIAGHDFYPQVEVDASRADVADVDSSFGVRLIDGAVEQSLVAVTLSDYEHLDAVVPAGLSPGVYDVVVVGPAGGSGALLDAYTVTSTRADRLVVDADDVVHTVHQPVSFTVELVDPAGQRVLEDFEVQVEVTGDGLDGQVSWSEGGLEGQVADGATLSGSLGDDGYALVAHTVTVPGTATITVEAANPRSGVAEGSLKLVWEPGEDLMLRIELPSDPFVATAGEEFQALITLQDQFGNTVEDADETVLLTDTCGSLVEPLTGVEGSATYDLAVTRATGSAECPMDRIEVTFGPPGKSADFEVEPGVADRLSVELVQTVLEAGDELGVFVTTVDAYGNRTGWDPGELSFQDSVGGVLTWECFGGETQFCRVTSVVAGDEIVLTVEEAGGVNGSSPPYSVVPAEPASVDVAPAGSTFVAGEAEQVVVTVRDEWSNLIPTAELDLELSDLFTEVLCELDVGGLVEGASYSCQLFTATSVNELTATLGGSGLTGVSSPVEVVNGPLAQVLLTPSAKEVVAGSTVLLAFDAFDAWSNPYLVQGDPVIQVSDTGGSLSVDEVSLDVDGTAIEAATFTLAGSTDVVASQSEVELGRYDSIAVVPAEAAQLVVGLVEPWVWTEVPVGVEVEARDEWENRASWSGSVSVDARSGLASSVVLDLVDGQGSGEMTWSEAVFDEVVDAVGGGLSGESEAVDVVAVCLADGPTVVADFGGHDYAIACFDGEVGEATISASLDGSLAGAEALERYALWIDGSMQSGSSPFPSVVLSRTGTFEVRAMVAQEDGCGDEVSASAWVGLDDGGAVGPLQVESADGSIDAGEGATTIGVVGAVDCARDPASGAQVLLRTDRGEVLGAAASGAGLVLALDSAGDGEVTLDATAQLTGGEATVWAWAESGAALGSVRVDVDGDFERPRVWSWDPAGLETGLVDELTLRFSEPLRPGSVRTERFEVVGPSEATVDDVDLEGDNDVVVVTLAEAVQGDSGTWTVTAQSSIRDVSGNRLDGALDGTASNWVGTFGDLVPSLDPVTWCVPDTAVFRPDGDDGAGAEADTVGLDLRSASAPTSWVVAVEDDEGTLLRVERALATGAADSWVWDGRDARGRVVDGGDYQITVDAEDGLGNRGGSCSTWVTVDHRVGD